jgi:hypothetical protein
MVFDFLIFLDNEVSLFDDDNNNNETEDDFDWESGEELKPSEIDAVKSSCIGCLEEEQIRWLVYARSYISFVYQYFLSYFRTRWKRMPLSLADDSMFNYNKQDENDAYDCEDISLDVHSMNLGNSKKSLSNSKNDHGSNKENSFFSVIKDLVYSGQTRNQSVENVLLEVKSFKFAQNKGFSDCIKAALAALFDVIANANDVLNNNDNNSNVKLIQSVKQTCTISKDLFGYKILKGLLHTDDDQ